MKHPNNNKIFMYFVVTMLMLTGFCLILTKYSKYLNRKDANVKVDNSYYKLAINNNNSNIIKVSKKTQNLTNITLTSLNEETKNYELSYTLCSTETCTKEVKDNNVKVEYSSKTTDKPKGTINQNEEKYIRVFINNQSNKDYYLKISLKSSKNNDTLIASKYDEGDNLLAAYIDGVSSTSYPSSSSYNAEVVCKTTGVSEANSTAWGNAYWSGWAGNKWIVTINDITAGNTKCTTYFTTKYSYANAPTGTLLYKIRTSYTADGASTKTTPGQETATANEGIRTTTDDYGTSYYYRGNITNNYVEFANMCWRILRVTGNGDIKIVLHNGNAANASNPCNVTNNLGAFTYNKSGTTVTYNQVAFNSLYTKAYYTGFMYDDSSFVKNTLDSIALTNLKAFYDSYLKQYNEQIADTIYCSDKTNDGSAAISRVGSAPTLACPTDQNLVKSGLYTATDSDKGNAKLRGINGYGSKSYKIGLLSADELAFAGYNQTDENTNVFLNENTGTNPYWTMTPAANGAPYEMFYVSSSHKIDIEALTYSYYIRPVIALLSSTKVTGSGTKTDPFVVS